MAYAGATFADTRSFDGPAVAPGDFPRSVIRPLAVALTTVTAAIALVAAVIFSTIWLLGAAFSTHPNFHGHMPLTPELRALAGHPHLRLTGTAQFAGAAPSMTRTAYARDFALQAGLHRALAAARAAPPQPPIAPVETVQAKPLPPLPQPHSAPAPVPMQLATLEPAPQPAPVPRPAPAPVAVAAPPAAKPTPKEANKVPLPPRRPADAPPAVATHEVARASAARAAPELITASLPPPQAPKQPKPRATARIDVPGFDAHTAVYDIAAHTVYMPDGARLEAHSGIGFRRDDPRYVDRRNRGPTPPNSYELALRGHLFHGVQAIRLNPVDEDKMFGRDGMLAHTYMLGPSGQSNGCVSFKHYAKFLRAYQKGEVERLVVVRRLEGKLARAVHARNATRYALND